MKQKTAKKAVRSIPVVKLSKRKVDEAYRYMFANGIPQIPVGEFKLYKSLNVIESANAGV